MISERKVLSRIEDFQQRRRRIAAEVHPEFVYLIEHHHRVVHPGSTQRLDYPPGHRAYVRAPVAAKLSFVAHAAKRHSLKLASH